MRARLESNHKRFGANGVNLVLGPGATFRGRVRAEGSVDLSKIQVALRPRQSSPFGYVASEPGVQPDGSFELRNVPDGSYHIEMLYMQPSSALYLKSATLGGQDVLESGFTVANGQAPGSTLDIVVSANGGRIGGVVILGDKISSDSRVTLAPADESKLSGGLWFKGTTTDQNGNFLLQGIRPGKYRVFAWEKIEPGEDQDPSFLSRFKDDSQKVQVMENSTQTLQLQAIPASKTQAAQEK